jgi:cytochrome P450 family 110
MVILDKLLWLKDPYQYLDRALARKGLTFRARLPVLGSCVFTGDPELISAIQRNKDLIGGRGTRALRPVVGNESMIVLEGDRHELHRSVFVPPFFAPERSGVDRLTLDWAHRIVHQVKSGGRYSAIDLVTSVTLNVIVEVVFGPLLEARQRQIIGLIEQWLVSFRQPIVLFLRALHLDLGPSSPWGRFQRNRAAVATFITDEIARRREDPGAGLLGHAIACVRAGKYLSDDELVSESITFLLFGHDTTAAAMGWVLYHLGRHRTIRQRVIDEWNENGEADPEANSQLTSYTRAVVEESMRLCPVVVHLTRHAIRATSVGLHAIAKDERVLPCAYLAHHNPAVFEDPYSFRPERFLGQRDYRNAYFPFGFGSRICAGMPFALRQMVTLTGLFVSRLSYQLAEPDRIRPTRKMVLIVPSGGPLLQIA